MGAYCGLRVVMLATLKNRVRVGDARSPVLTSPQEVLVLIGSSQQMVLEGQMAIQREHHH